MKYYKGTEVCATNKLGELPLCNTCMKPAFSYKRAKDENNVSIVVCVSCYFKDENAETIE